MRNQTLEDGLVPLLDQLIIDQFLDVVSSYYFIDVTPESLVNIRVWQQLSSYYQQPVVKAVAVRQSWH